jgi:hypothetical protein
MLADTGAKKAAERLGMDLNDVTRVFNEEIGGVTAQLSVMLSHVEGRYESDLANLKVKLVTQKFLVPSLIGILALGAAIGFVLGRIFS